MTKEEETSLTAPMNHKADMEDWSVENKRFILDRDIILDKDTRKTVET